ncbi:MAG: hypothetical protein J6K89_07450 [Oscillospiraceae bacterium]|nr:hypothetical protein [Oscillospiraceae bacterium]
MGGFISFHFLQWKPVHPIFAGASGGVSFPIRSGLYRSNISLKSDELISIAIHQPQSTGVYYMVYGAINEKGEEFYTDLARVFDAIRNKQIEYNWLITDYEGNTNDPAIVDRLEGEYCWISGEELTELVANKHFQWIWAVLSAFEKSVSLSKVLEHRLPYADGYEGFWKLPLSMQHPLAKIEIVPWDSTSTLLFSESKEITDLFRGYFPNSQDLEEYNRLFYSSQQ